MVQYKKKNLLSHTGQLPDLDEASGASLLSQGHAF